MKNEPGYFRRILELSIKLIEENKLDGDTAYKLARMEVEKQQAQLQLEMQESK